MSQPRFTITAHLGRTGGIDRFLAAHQGPAGLGEAHLLWVTGPENAKVSAAMLGAAQTFQEHRQALLTPVLGATHFSGGTVVLMQAAVMLDLNSACSGDLPEAALLEVASQTAGLMAHLARVTSAAHIHRHLSAETIFLTREGSLRVDPVLAAAGSWPLRDDAHTLADPPDAAWSLGKLIVELLGGSEAMSALMAAIASASTPAMHRTSIKQMLAATRASPGLQAVTLDLLEWYSDRRTPVDEAGRRLMRLGPDRRALQQWAERLPQVAWGWRDDAHPMVGIGTLERGGQGAAGARSVQRVRPTGRGGGRRLLDSGESTDFLQDQRFAEPDVAPAEPLDPLDHFPSAGPASAVTQLDQPPETAEVRPPGPGVMPVAPGVGPAPSGGTQKASLMPLYLAGAALFVLMAGGLVGLFVVLVLAWLLG